MRSAYVFTFREQACNVLLSWSSATGVLVYEWRVYDRTLFDTFLDPQVRFDVFAWNPLIVLHQVLEDFGVRVGQDYTCCLSRCARVSPRVLELVNSRAITLITRRQLTMILALSAARAFILAMLESMWNLMASPFSTKICFNNIPEILHAST